MLKSSYLVAMIFIWFLVLAAFAANADCASRIVGGTSASIEEYPSLAQLEVRNLLGIVWFKECAANIISTQYLLTAAHCFAIPALVFNRDFRIRVGSTFRERGNIYNINRRIIHPSYGRNGYDGNIAIIQLRSHLVFSATVRPAVLPPQGFELFDNSPVTLAGWGTTRVGGGGSASQALQQVQVEVVNRKRCAAIYNQLARPLPVTENMICAGTTGKNSCQGDGGGPVFFNHDILTGIISWGTGCGNAAYPAVSTKVSSYIDWINSIVS